MSTPQATDRPVSGPVFLAPLAALGAGVIEWWQHAEALRRGGLEWAALAFDPRAARDRWLSAWSQTTDRYLRSPAFLEMMQHNLKALAKTNQFMFRGRFK